MLTVKIFDQNYAMEVYGRECKREGERIGKIQGVIETCRKLGATIDDAVRMVAESFGLTEENASKHVRKLWGN